MERWKRITSLILTIAAYFSVSMPEAYASDGYANFTMERTLRAMDAESNNSRWMDIPGLGAALYYAQNNDFWTAMRYEETGSATFRPFGEGGCCPTSVAIAIANLLPASELGKIRPYAASRAGGYGIAEGSMNPLNRPAGKGILWLEYAEEYQRYLPLVIGQYAAGNNLKRSSWRVKSRAVSQSSGGTGIRFLPELCAIYGVNYQKFSGKTNLDWVPQVQNGGFAVALANSYFHPFSSGDGHYVAIVGCDEEYLYIMDPQDKAAGEYKEDRNQVLEVVEKGLIRVKYEDYRHLHFSTVHVVTTDEIESRIAKDPQAGA